MCSVLQQEQKIEGEEQAFPWERYKSRMKILSPPPSFLALSMQLNTQHNITQHKTKQLILCCVLVCLLLLFIKDTKQKEKQKQKQQWKHSLVHSFIFKVCCLSSPFPCCSGCCFWSSKREETFYSKIYQIYLNCTAAVHPLGEIYLSLHDFCKILSDFTVDARIIIIIWVMHRNSDE